MFDFIPKSIADWPKDYEAKFWAHYPRRVARKAAFKALAKVANTVPWAIFLAGVERYAQWAKNEDNRFVAHAATWLNGERWNDETEANNGRPRSVQDAARDLHARVADRARQFRGDVPDGSGDGARGSVVRLLPKR